MLPDETATEEKANAPRKVQKQSSGNPKAENLTRAQR